jgi:hypothetical protein
MARFPLLLLVPSLLVLAACAPAAVGSRNNPVDLSRQGSVIASPGATVHVLASFPARSFGFGPSPFGDRLAVPIGGGQGVRIGSEFELVDVIAPEGWTWRVEDAWTISYGGRAPGFDVTLRIDVPATARLGGQQLRGALRARATGRTEPVAFVVQVTDRR